MDDTIFVKMQTMLNEAMDLFGTEKYREALPKFQKYVAWVHDGGGDAARTLTTPLRMAVMRCHSELGEVGGVEGRKGFDLGHPFCSRLHATTRTYLFSPLAV